MSALFQHEHKNAISGCWTHDELPVLVDLLSVLPPVLVDLSSTTHDRLLQLLRIVPSRRRQIRVGLVRVLDQRLPRAGEVDRSRAVVDVLRSGTKQDGSRDQQERCRLEGHCRTDHEEEDDSGLEVPLDPVDDDAFSDVDNLDPRNVWVDDGLVEGLLLADARVVVLDRLLGIPAFVLERVQKKGQQRSTSLIL